MKRTNLLFSLLLISGSLNAQNWPAVQQEAKPAARWWWLGSAVDSANLTYNLQEYARAGMGGVEITPIYGVQGNDQNNIAFLSPQWMKMLRHTQTEGKRVGIEIDMNTGTGWPFGGPDVSIEDAATKAIFKEYQADGGKIINLNIGIQDEKQESIAILSRVMAYSDNGKSFNLTTFAANGLLTWKAPKGKWRIIVLYVGKTLQKVKRAAPGGEGYVMNHFSKSAVQHYLKKFDKAFQENATPYPHTFFNDSYEVYGADWTPDFLEQFEQRRGYKLEEHFPEFLDEKRSNVTARIISDYRETISDLLIENFSQQWTDWAHKNGSITRNQAHGSPANLIDTYASVDIPECEGFGLSQFNIKGLRQDSLTRKNDSDLSMLKYASSAAHITGKPFTSSETFTWLTEHFRTSLSQCKPDMDLMFASGVNHMFFHGTAYSPKNAAWPGWKFYASIDMSPTNSIWRDAPSFFQYITRCQSFLQMGKPDNDFLVYLPVYDMWYEQPGRLLQFTIHDMAKRAPKFIETINSINRSGYDVDYISDKYIRTTSCQNGQLVTSGGTAYKAIIIPGIKIMPTDVLTHLLYLAQNGATLVFTDNYPTDVPGFGQMEARQAELMAQLKRLPNVSFSDTKDTAFGKGKILTGNDFTSLLQICGRQPEELQTVYGMHYLRRINKNGHHYFISSLQDKGMDGWVTLAKPIKSAIIFNPMTGEKGLADVRLLNGKQQVRLQLKSGESTILQTFDAQTPNVEKWKYIREQTANINLNHGWKLHFIESAPQINGTFNIDTPTSWTEINHPNATKTMATGVYTLEFKKPKAKVDDWILDLGDVRESARIRINGQNAGTVWAVPFQLKIGKYLKAGKNTLEVEVTNLPANRIADMDKNGMKWRIFNEINVVNLNYEKKPYNDWQPMPSGLNGNVKLIPINYE